MHFLGLVRPWTEYCGIQVSSVGCFVPCVSPCPPAVVASSCKLLDPGTYHCHFLTPCQEHCGHIPASFYAIISTKWKLRPIGMMMKCSDQICCLYRQWSKILRSTAKYMHRSVSIQVLRNKWKQLFFPTCDPFCSLGVVNLCNFCEMLLQQIWIESYISDSWQYILLCCIFICYIVTHLATKYRQIGQILQATAAGVRMCLCFSVWQLIFCLRKRCFLVFFKILLKRGTSFCTLNACVCMHAHTHIKSINTWILTSEIFAF